MAQVRAENGRVRAWVLVWADDPVGVAEELYEELRYEGEDEYVVVRADVVESFYGYNIVIPVDAQDQGSLDLVLKKIRNPKAVKRMAVLRVETHNPYPPQDASGYVTEGEAEAGDEDVKVGRQDNSPGLNPWG
jgi:hypothetical protein